MSFPDRFDAMRARWHEILTGGETQSGGKYTADKIEDITHTALTYWSSIRQHAETKSLWDDLDNPLGEKNAHESFRRIEAMALAYCTDGSSLQHSSSLKKSIADALEWMYAHCYNEHSQLGQQWFFKMGIPLTINNLLVMLHDELPGQLQDKLMKAVAAFSTDTSYHGVSTACNRIWRCMVVVVHGILAKDAERIAFGVKELTDPSGCVFGYAEKGDGYYKDGSFIQHKYYAYTGGYGKDSLHVLAHLLYLIHNSPWSLDPKQAGNVYRWIYDSYEPFLYKGQMMDMTRGREISREEGSAYHAGHLIMQGILLLSKIATDKDAELCRSMLKHWIVSETGVSFYSHATVYMIKEAKRIVEDSSLAPRGEPEGHKAFRAMDQVVHMRGGYRFGISMCSDRTGNFESINYENLKAWHTGDGMTFLYNDDLLQYDDHYMTTIDWKRLPGTTVDSDAFADDSASAWNTQNKEVFFNTGGWTGGTAVQGRYGVCGMRLMAEGTDLDAKKSWFMFDDEIVCLGSGIGSHGAGRIETVVENRKINTGGAAVMTVDGEAYETRQPLCQMLQSPRWGHLRVNETDTGYAFPSGGKLEVRLEERTGSWQELNKWYGSGTRHSRQYASLTLHHGVHPADGEYSYIMLPNKTREETEAYCRRPAVAILEDSPLVHAVKHETLHIIGANFWEDAENGARETAGRAGGMTTSSAGIACDRKASVMLSVSAGVMEVAVADPTHRNNGSIRLELDFPAEGIIMADPGIEVESLSPFIRLAVHVGGAKGASFHALFRMVTQDI